jgi:hypothetical protein
MNISEKTHTHTQTITYVTYHKLTCVWPGELGEALDCHQAIIAKLPLVHHIGRPLSTLRNYEFAAEPIGRRSQLHQAELLEARNAVALLQLLPIISVHKKHPK